ncbi:MAG: ribosome silencing factor [Gammaproteobacteria bacterium]|nr:MAG: ribosome silencing factor [Gammaproteobacteria bacterium]
MSNTITPPPLLTTVQEALDDLKAVDVLVIDVSSVSSATDFMVIASGSSSRHTKSIAENVIEQSKKAGTCPLGVEGMVQPEWVLVDLGDIVVHIMQAETRRFYDLESLWQTGLNQDKSQNEES